MFVGLIAGSACIRDDSPRILMGERGSRLVLVASVAVSELVP